MKQPLSGYRYTIDPVLLAHFILPKPGDRIMDLGTGSGIIPLILAHRHPDVHVWGIEIQDRLASLARLNILENSLEKRVAITWGDMTQPANLPVRQSMDRVLSNPPYIPCQSGRLNPDEEKAIARHEIRITLLQVVSTASYLLKENGSLALILPFTRLDELTKTLESSGFKLQRLRRVLPFSGASPKRVLVEAVKDSGVVPATLPPLVIFSKPGQYSDEIKNMFQ